MLKCADCWARWKPNTAWYNAQGIEPSTRGCGPGGTRDDDETGVDSVEFARLVDEVLLA